ncbi:MAG: KRRI-Interacting protein 1 [Candelina submexicana]|nr:MAG: KRRI-Interacting protein 1 [Candelina submexicana]
MESERPAKRAKILLEDNGSEEGSDSQSLNAEIPINGDHSLSFKINEEYAKRFEHNKRREEMQRLEEKYGKTSGAQQRKAGPSVDGDEAVDPSDSSSESEDEDDEGLLVTEALDSEISATLQAIRSKDPRVYDEKITFYSEFNDQDDGLEQREKREKPMFLKDYHRQNLLKGEQDEADDPLPTYAQEQADLKSAIVQEMHAAAKGGGDNSSVKDDDGTDDDGGFIRPKSKRVAEGKAEESLGESKKISHVDVTLAEKDPENFLSYFMSARGWVLDPSSRSQPFESDDEEEEQRAEAFETAYNLRFEDPKGANEKLMSHARDAAAKYSVRREEPNSRKKARDAQRQRREAEKQAREEDKARLKRLKIEEVEQKVRKIKDAAGLRGERIKQDDWARFLEDGWDDDKWEEEMNRTFGESYYAEGEVSADDLPNGAAGRTKNKIKKPKWDEDIHIDDLVPDFRDEEGNEKPQFTLSDDDKVASDSESVYGVAGDGSNRNAAINPSRKKGKTKKDRLQERNEQKREARIARKKIEQLVDDKFDANQVLPPSSSKHGSYFRYRETSPLSYGLTSRDILEAEDRQLNQYVGLKKMAAFRDPEKKRKDKKKLGKKARLREWRKETFGHEDGPRVRPQEVSAPRSVGKEEDAAPNGEHGLDIREGKKKKKRSRKGKRHATEIATPV